MDHGLASRVEGIVGVPATGSVPLSGGCIAPVFRVTLADGSAVVVKSVVESDSGGPSDPADSPLDQSTEHPASSPQGAALEAAMLAALEATSTVRTPRVLGVDGALLVLEYIEHDGSRSEQGQTAFAEQLAALHAVTADAFGYDHPTPIGPLMQDNRWVSAWPEFFADHRIRAASEWAARRGGISNKDATALDRLCARMDDLIGEPPARPALIHGDLWAGNVLWKGGEAAAVIDPALYYADPEIELAFIDLMGSASPAFFARYDTVAGIRPGFWQTRRDLYNLYPLLVHAALFGGGYGAGAMAIAERLGFPRRNT